jgi:hypothetical protein
MGLAAAEESAVRLQRWTRAALRVLAPVLAAGGLGAAPAARAVVLQDGGWQVETDLTSQAGIERWQDPFGVDHAGQVWYWLSFGDGDRTPLNSVGSLTTTLTDSDGDGASDSVNALYAAPSLDVTLNQRLSDGGSFGSEDLAISVSALTSVLTVKNVSSVTFSDLRIWFYTDMELLGTPEDDVLGSLSDLITGEEPFDLRIAQVDSLDEGEAVYESDLDPLVRALLSATDGGLSFAGDDGFLNFLNNVANDPGGQEDPVEGGDLSALAFFGFDLAPGESVQLLHNQSLFTPVPEPGTAALLALGLLGLALGAPRRRA